MKTRTWVATGGVAVLLGAWVLVGHFLTDSTHLSKQPSADTRPKEVDISDELKSTSTARFLADKTPEASDSARTLARAEKVRAGLARFEAKTKGITRESLERERKKLERVRKEMLERPTASPRVDSYENAHGQRWERLTYENGAVRYELPESP